MAYKNIVTGDDYIFKTLLPSILLNRNLKGLYSLANFADIEIYKHSDVDVFTDFTLVLLGINHKNIWPLGIRIDNALIFLAGELSEAKGADYWTDYMDIGEKYIRDIITKDSKIDKVKQIIVTNEELGLETKHTKIVSWNRILHEFSFDYRDDYAYKNIKERYAIKVGEYDTDREEEDLSFDVIKSMCRIHKERLYVLYKGGTASLTMTPLSNLESSRYNYLISDDPLLANKETSSLIRGDVFLMIVNKKS